MSGYKVGILTNEAVASLNKLEAGFKKAKAQSKKHEDALKTFKKQLGDTGGGLNTFKSQLGGLVKWIGAAAIAYKTFQAAVDAVKVGAKFQHEMNAVKAVTRATVSQFAALTDAAKQAGATTEFSASQAAQALKFLGMAGLTAEESIAALPGTINLATAGNIDLATSADIATNILSGMNLAVSELGNVNDVLIATTTRSNTNITELGDAMKYVAPLASGLGYSIEETSAFLGILANSGLKASIAGTNLSGIFRRLPKIFEALGMDGEGKTVVDAFEEISKQGWDAGKIMKEFGAISGKAAIILSNNTEELKKFTGELNNSSGEAEAAAEIMRSGVTGALKELNSTLEGMKIEFFERFKGEIEASIKLMTSLVRITGSLFGITQKITIASKETAIEEQIAQNQKLLDIVREREERAPGEAAAIERMIEAQMKLLISLRESEKIEVRKKQHIESQIKAAQDQADFWKEINSEMDKLISKDERRLKLQEQMKQAALEAQIKAAAEQGALQPIMTEEDRAFFAPLKTDPAEKYKPDAAQSQAETAAAMTNVVSAIAKLIEMVINFFYDLPDRLESAMSKVGSMGGKWEKFLSEFPQMLESSITDSAEIWTKGFTTLISVEFREALMKSIYNGLKNFFADLFGGEVDRGRDITEEQLDALKGLKKSMEGDKGLSALVTQFNNLEQQRSELEESSKDYWGDQIDLGKEQIETLSKIKQEQEKTRDELKSALDKVRESIDVISGAEYSLALAPETMEDMSQRYTDLLASAQGGDLDAAAELSTFIQPYLKQAQALYGSSVEYQQIYGQVLQDMMGIEGVLDAQLTDAERQLAETQALKDTLHADLTRLIEIGEEQVVPMGIDENIWQRFWGGIAEALLQAFKDALQWFWDTLMGSIKNILDSIKAILEGDIKGGATDLITGGDGDITWKDILAPGFADGGAHSGPISGYPILAHGNEATIPLKNGSIPVQMDNSSVVSAINSQNRILLAILEKDLKIDAKAFDNRVSKVADKTTHKSNNRNMAGRVYA